MNTKLEEIRNEMIKSNNVDIFGETILDILKNEDFAKKYKELLSSDIQKERKELFSVLFDNLRGKLYESFLFIPVHHWISAVCMFPMLARYVKYISAFEFIHMIPSQKGEVIKGYLKATTKSTDDGGISIIYDIEEVCLASVIQECKIPAIMKYSIIFEMIKLQSWNLLEDYIDNMSRLIADYFDRDVIRILISNNPTNPTHNESFSLTSKKDQSDESSFFLNIIPVIYKLGAQIFMDSAINPGNLVVCSKNIADELTGENKKYDTEYPFTIGYLGFKHSAYPVEEKDHQRFKIIGTDSIPKDVLLVLSVPEEYQRSVAACLPYHPFIPIQVPTNECDQNGFPVLDDEISLMRQDDIKVIHPGSIGIIKLVK